jgi:DNA-binding transcriptional LysR family regulator
MDRLTGMTVFARVVECGGFSAAARRLAMSPAMASNHVRELEERLGVRLLNRTTRQVSLTDIGKEYYEQCSQILAAIQEADEAAAARHAKPTGILRLNCTTALGPLIAPVAAEYLGRYEDMAVEVIMTERMVDLIDEGFDLAVRMTPVPESSLISRRLAGYRHVLCAAPDYIAQRGAPQAPADIARHNCLQYAHYPFGDEWHFTGADGEHRVRVRGNLETNNGEMLRLAVLRGLGLALMPRFLIAAELRSGQLVPLLEAFPPRQLSIQLVYPHRHHLSAKVRSFIDLLIDRTASLILAC